MKKTSALVSLLFALVNPIIACKPSKLPSSQEQSMFAIRPVSPVPRVVVEKPREINLRKPEKSTDGSVKDKPEISERQPTKPLKPLSASEWTRAFDGRMLVHANTYSGSGSATGVQLAKDMVMLIWAKANRAQVQQDVNAIKRVLNREQVSNEVWERYFPNLSQLSVNELSKATMEIKNWIDSYNYRNPQQVPIQF